MNTNKNYGTFETPFGTATVTTCQLGYVIATLPAGTVVNRVAHSTVTVSAYARDSCGGGLRTGAYLRREEPKGDGYSYDGTEAARDKVVDEVGPRLLAWIEENDAALWAGEVDRRAAWVRSAMRDVQNAQQELAEREAQLVEVQAELAQAEWMRETLEDLDEVEAYSVGWTTFRLGGSPEAAAAPATTAEA